jgi:hypothetical protein
LQTPAEVARLAMIARENDGLATSAVAAESVPVVDFIKSGAPRSDSLRLSPSPSSYTVNQSVEPKGVSGQSQQK